LERLTTRDLRASFFEARAAKRLLEHGFSIEIRPEQVLRGDDFDIAATRDGVTVNVEVTETRVPTFSAKTYHAEAVERDHARSSVNRIAGGGPAAEALGGLFASGAMVLRRLAS